MTINKDNCPLFNTGLYIEKVSQTTSKIGMCCFQRLSTESYDSVDFENNNYLQKLRNVQGNVIECRSCELDESRGIQSHRQGHILANGNSSQNELTKLTTLTYNCENTCNLACLTCGPRYSSKWKPDYQRLGLFFPTVEKTSTHKNNLYRDLDLSSLRFLHFQGGEPLLTRDHVDVLTKIEQQNNLENVVVSYNTNGNFLPSTPALELWRKAKLVKLYFSIDAVGEQYNIVRSPGNWEEVEKVLMYYKNLDLSNIWIEIGLTVSLANLFYIQDVINWRDQYFSHTCQGNEIKIYITFAGAMSYGGKVLALDNISGLAKTRALQYVSGITDGSIRNALTTAINAIKEKQDLNEVVAYLDKIDQYRGTDWKKSLSKLQEVINE